MHEKKSKSWSRYSQKALLLGVLLGTGALTSTVSSEALANQHSLSDKGIGFSIGIPVIQASDNPVILQSARGAYAVQGDELLVRLDPNLDHQQARFVLEGLGLDLREVGRYSGIFRVGLPQGLNLEQGLSRLRSHSAVQLAWPNAIMDGTADDGQAVPAEYRDYQWAHERLDIDGGRALDPVDLSTVTIAVLDTGAAYETWQQDGHQYVKHPGLSQTAFVAPYDSINGDFHANDDNHHGTHVTGIIAAQGGKTDGAAQGVTIMPVKVLDYRKQGTELALLEGIYHAISNGADIINLSLTFGLGYYPSPDLQEAIAYSQEMDIVVVAATGNTSAVGVSYPAAFPDVIAVGATRLSSFFGMVYDAHAYYSSWGFQVDVLAPGGLIQTDINEDGQPDGILAPAFPLNQPEQPQYWFMAGTSQAAPFVSSMAAYLLVDGVDPALVRETMVEAGNSACISYLNYYCGGGQTDLLTLRESPVASDGVEIPVNVTTWLEEDADGNLIGVAEVLVIDPDTLSVKNMAIGGSWMGSHLDPNELAWTGKDGVSRFTTPPLDPNLDIALSFQVDRVWYAEGGKPFEPVGFYSLSPAMAESIAMLSQDDVYRDALLLLEVGNTGVLPEVGTLTTSFMLKSLGTGMPAGPISMVINPRMLATLVGNPGAATTLTFPGKLTTGDGSTKSFNIRFAQNGNVKIVTMPFDPAIGRFDTSSFFPIINAAHGEFADVNEVFGNKLSSLGYRDFVWNFPNTDWGTDYLSHTLGDGFAHSAIGSGFAVSSFGTYLGPGFPMDATQGDGFAFSAMGTGFATSSFGTGFAVSSFGTGFLHSAMGTGFAVSSFGSSHDDSTMGSSNGNGNGNGNGNQKDAVDPESLSDESDLTEEFLGIELPEESDK